MASSAGKIGTKRRNGFVFVEMVTKRKYNGSWKIQEGLDRITGSFIPSVG